MNFQKKITIILFFGSLALLQPALSSVNVHSDIQTSGFVKSPYLLYSGKNSEMLILWQTSDTKSCRVDWGTDLTYATGSQVTTEYGADHQHKITLTGLTPGTKYFYKVTIDNSELKKGDFVIIQFGHNDVGKYNDPAAKDRPALHSEGDETAEVTRLDGKTETVHSFGWYMRKYGNDAKAKGATVIFCSMVPHKDWDNGKIIRKESETFVKWTANAAQATGAAFINLNEMIALEFEKTGMEKVATFFGDARTHSTPAGALFNAQIVIAGLRGLSNPKLDKYLSDKGKSIEKMPKYVFNAKK